MGLVLPAKTKRLNSRRGNRDKQKLNESLCVCRTQNSIQKYIDRFIISCLGVLMLEEIFCCHVVISKLISLYNITLVLEILSPQLHLNDIEKKSNQLER